MGAHKGVNRASMILVLLGRLVYMYLCVTFPEYKWMSKFDGMYVLVHVLPMIGRIHRTANQSAPKISKGLKLFFLFWPLVFRMFLSSM